MAKKKSKTRSNKRQAKKSARQTSGRASTQVRGRTNAQSNKPTMQSSKPTKQAKGRNIVGRTARGRVPQGRTLTTHDNFLSGGKKTGSTKKRPLVVIEANSKNDLAVVPLSSRDGKNRTELKEARTNNKKSFFKHFVEIADNEGKPIRINDKFKENHKNMDISQKDVENIRNIVFNHSKPKEENKKLISKFRNKKD
ncbi:MAG: hypothetical protein OSJ67_00615 [Clostridia bacterium]|nr:hypothetical protein [Clostridia bacterium]